MHLSDRITEDELISNCKAGSLKHQELLYKQFYGFAMGISVRYCINTEDALEVVNDTFIKAFNNIRKYEAGKPFKAWLRTLLVNTAIDRRRKELKHRNNIDLDNAIHIGQKATAAEHLNAQDILKIMKQLPRLQLTVFNMYEIDGYSHDEIANALNMPASSSRVYLSRAKEKLRQLITLETQRHG